MKTQDIRYVVNKAQAEAKVSTSADVDRPPTPQRWDYDRLESSIRDGIAWQSGSGGQGNTGRGINVVLIRSHTLAFVSALPILDVDQALARVLAVRST